MNGILIKGPYDQPAVIGRMPHSDVGCRCIALAGAKAHMMLF
jgi:hypothetical protein